MGNQLLDNIAAPKDSHGHSLIAPPVLIVASQYYNRETDYNYRIWLYISKNDSWVTNYSDYQLQWMGVQNLKPGIYNNVDIDNK